MNKNELLDDLFKKWVSHYPSYQNQFIRDGIIREDFYDQQNPKILFITKEANDQTGQLVDFRQHWNKPLQYSFDYRIAEIVYGIQNNFPPFEDIYNDLKNNYKIKYENALKAITFMDVKKTCGKSRCDHKALLKNINENIDFLQKQIEIISPDIIISGLVKRELVTALFDGIEFKKTGYVRCVARWKKYKLIDFYHPSGQSVPSAMYCLMKNIYQSNAFKQL